jgi:hypothetical protein
VTRLACALAIVAALTACATPRSRMGVPPAAVAAERPVPWPVELPPAFRRAIERGTRTVTGKPGSAYWVQWADYTLTARLDPAARRLDGEGRIVYRNRSPDALGRLELQLLQNLHAPASVRNEPVEVTGGIELVGLALDGREIPALAVTPEGGADAARPAYLVRGTRLTILLAESLPAGGGATIELAWSFPIPRQGAGARMGWNGDDLVFVAYWYPQMAVYDDVVGWQTDPFLGNAEFYTDHGSYDVTIEAPAGWLVRATGELTNPEATLSPAARERLAAAVASDSVVRVASAGEDATLAPAGGRRLSTGSAGAARTLSWRFAADSVRDFAFVAASSPNWDATRTTVGDRDGDGADDHARIEAVWRASAPRWKEVARYAQHAIHAHSEFTATPYPWPHMTAVEGGGIIGGGMEFPMMTLIGDYNVRGDSALYYVTSHELAHMWLPMIASNDERRAGWMDEGSTSFHENQARKLFFPGFDHDLPDQDEYLETARAAEEGEILRWSDFHTPGSAYNTASYSKPATMLTALRAMLGEETFLRAWHAFFDRWAWRHPYPWDLFATFEDAAGRDLDWYWRSWYLETWTLDQAVADVREEGGAWTIVVEDLGLAPMPVDLAVTRADGSVERREVAPDAWLAGSRRVEVELPGADPIVRVEIDPERDYPDIDRSNNVWPR